MTYSKEFLTGISDIALTMDIETIEGMVRLLVQVRDQGGRLFFIGVGGSAANSSHAVNDFRKIAGIEAYAPTDNVAELSARTNDEGWITVFSEWLKVSRLTSRDCIFVLSVGGGDRDLNISQNLCEAIDYGKSIGCQIIGLVGRSSGYTNKLADLCLVVPFINSENLTPYSESFQSVVLHLLVSHPDLKLNTTKW